MLATIRAEVLQMQMDYSETGRLQTNWLKKLSKSIILRMEDTVSANLRMVGSYETQ